jgi:lysyl-tRNA synthetase, class II
MNQTETDELSSLEERKLNIYKEDINLHYPHKWELTHSMDELMLMKETYEDGAKDTDTEASFAGRIILKRPSGKNLCFYTLKKDGKIIQLASSKKDYEGDEFRQINKSIHRGDIVGIRGYMGKTHKGELTIFARKLQILAPCYQMLPKSFQRLVNTDVRYSKRHLDLIVNDDVREIFLTRSTVVKFLRNYLDEQNFIEVSTPVLTSLYGGASARPFETLHNELDKKMYMRIAPELYLKKLVVGGLDKVYEIGKQFRNEGIDTTHNPEFTSLEYYEAYVDYHDLMNKTEDMLSKMVYSLKNSYNCTFTNAKNETFNIDFSPPYKKFDMVTDLATCLECEIPINENAETINAFLIEQCDKHEIECAEPRTNARLYDKLVGHFLEVKCVNPTFLINHPKFMSPLAKWHRDNPNLTERFELFVCGMELCNAYTELNHPKIQQEAFEGQVEAKKLGDHEAQDYDESFIDALEFGLPPTGGFGMGIDRLVMLLTNHTSIKEVILFPIV